MLLFVLLCELILRWTMSCLSHVSGLMITNRKFRHFIKCSPVETHHLYLTNQYCSYRNVIYDCLNRLFAVFWNVSVQLVQNESSYMIAMFNSYIRLKKYERDSLRSSYFRIHRSHLHIWAFNILTFIVYNICYYKYKTNI
jgi:hypothetical protein